MSNNKLFFAYRILRKITLKVLNLKISPKKIRPSKYNKSKCTFRTIINILKRMA